MSLVNQINVGDAVNVVDLSNGMRTKVNVVGIDRDDIFPIEVRDEKCTVFMTFTSEGYNYNVLNDSTHKLELLEPVRPSISRTGTTSKTGSLRYNTGKAPLHLVPPDAVNAIAEVLRYGATKYKERNWELGNDLSVPYASLMRHLLAFWSGEDRDAESGLPHTYHVLMNAAMLLRYSSMDGFDDRPANLLDSEGK